MYDWSKYREEIDNGGSLWKTTSQIAKEAERTRISEGLYQQLSAARTTQNEQYQAEQKKKKVVAQQKVTTGKPWVEALTKAKTSTERYKTGVSSSQMFNPAANFGESLFNKEYKTNLKTEYRKKLEADYSKVSNYKVDPKIIKQNTVPGNLSTMDKFKNQTLGVFGNVKNLKKPKTVYQYKGGEIQDPVTGKMIESIWENVLQINVVAEDKDNYYYRVSPNESGTGTIQSVPKNQVTDKLPDLEEQKQKYMEYIIENRKPTATMYDKITFNVGEGIRKFAMGSETKAQLPTGNKALDIATNVGGELLGFGVPMGGAESLASSLGQVGEKAIGGLAKRSPTAISKQLTSGIGKAAAKGAVEMGVYSGMEKKTDKESYLKSVLEDMFVGSLFMGTLYAGGKGASKLINTFKKIPGNPDTENLVKAAADEYKNAIDDLNVRDTDNFQTLKQEAADKFSNDIETISAKYKKVEPSKEVKQELPFEETGKIVPSNKESLLSKKSELEGKLSDLEGMHETATKAEKTVLAKQIESTKNEISNLDLQLLGTNRQQQIEPSSEQITENLAKTKTHIVSKSDVKSSKENWFDKIYRNVIDRNRSLQTLTKKGGATENLATSNPYKLSNMASTYEGVAKSNIEQQLSDKTGKKVSEGLSSIFKDVPKEKTPDLKDYLVLRQAEFLSRVYPDKSQVYPKEWGLTTESMAKKLKEMEQSNPEFRGLSKRFTKYNNNLVKTQLVDSGLLSPEEYNTITKANPFYNPLKRAMLDVETPTSGTKAAFTGQGQQIKYRKGSERQVIDPFESMIENTFNYAKAAKRNEVGATVYEMVAKEPEKFKGMIEVVQKQQFGDDLEKAVDEGDLTGFIDNINQGFEIKGIKDLSKPNVVRIRINGENKYMQVHDKALLDSLSYMNKDQINKMVEGVRAVTGSMKTLTTGINPMFGIGRNIWRDVVTGYVQSKTTSKIPIVNYAQYMGDLVGSVIGTLGKTKNYKEYRSLGGGFFSSAIGTEKNLLKETVAKYTEKDVKGKAKRFVKSFGGVKTALEWFNNTLETMPRYAEYNRTLKQLRKQGVDEYSAKMEAIYNGQEVTVNFMRSGEVTKSADAFVPYLNAAVQGIDKTLRTLDPRNPAQLANVISKGVTSITIPALMLYALNHDNEKYQELSDYIKDNNFLIPLDKKGTFMKIPKPREYGILLGSLPERIARQYADGDPKAWKNFKDAIIQNWVPPNALTENIGAPIVRNVMSPEGRTWRGTPVVPQSLLKYSPKKQYDQNTSAVAKFMGEKLNFAPMKVDELMKSYLGGVSQIGKPLTSSRTMNETGVIKAAIEVLKKQVTSESRYSNDIANEFYDNMEKVNMKKADMEGKLGEEETYIDSGTYVYNNIADQLSDMRKEQKAAKTNQEKDKIQDKMNELMKNTNQDYNDNYTKKKKMSTVKRKRAFKRGG